jgi:hypothetical protein
MDFNATKANSTVGQTGEAAVTARVTSTLTLELIDANGVSTPLETELSYDPSDPYAVTAAFLTVAGRVEWTFGRDLLIGGLYEPTGDGDVHVWPCLDGDARSVVIIELCSPDGEALVQARAADMNAFVERMTTAVAPGAESIDVDATIAAILAETA